LPTLRIRNIRIFRIYFKSTHQRIFYLFEPWKLRPYFVINRRRLCGATLSQPISSLRPARVHLFSLGSAGLADSRWTAEAACKSSDAADKGRAQVWSLPGMLGAVGRRGSGGGPGWGLRWPGAEFGSGNAERAACSGTIMHFAQEAPRWRVGERNACSSPPPFTGGEGVVCFDFDQQDSVWWRVERSHSSEKTLDAVESRSECLRPVVYPSLIGFTSCNVKFFRSHRSSMRALPARLKFRHKFNRDSLLLMQEVRV